MVFWEGEKKVYVNIFLILLALAFAGFSSQIRTNQTWCAIVSLIILAFALVVLIIEAILNNAQMNMEMPRFKKTLKSWVNGFVLIVLGVLAYHLLSLMMIINGMNTLDSLIGQQNIIGIAIGALLFLLSFVLMFV
jgi:hypothetical protein